MKRSRSKFLCMLFAILLSLSVIPFAAFAAAEPADEFDAPVTVDDGLSMTPGASIRTEEDYGIRFEAKVCREFLDTWGEENVKEVGMLLAPTAYIGEDFSEASLEEGKYLRVKSSGYAEGDEKTGKTYRVALVGFKDSQDAFTMNFSARAYAVVNDPRTGKTVTCYSPYDANENSRSLADVALGCKGTGDYDDNSIINHILDVVDADYTWLQNPDNTQGRKPGEVAKLRLDSFEFTAENVGDILPHNLDVVRVQATPLIQVGQQVEFDYAWLATNNHAENNAEYDLGWGEFYFWLKDASRNFKEGYYNAFKMQYRSGLPDGYNTFATSAQNAGLFNCAESGVYGEGCVGFSKFWNSVNDHKSAFMCSWQEEYHFTVSVYPGVNGNAPMVNVTVTEKNCETGKPHSYTFVRPGSTDMVNQGIALVFGSARLSYRISNLKVVDIPSQFCSTDWSNGNEVVSFEKDAFRYTNEMIANDYLYESFVTSNMLVTAGQKVEFDYEMLETGDTGEAFFWIKEPHEPIRDWNNNNFVNFGLRFVHDKAADKFSVGAGRISPEAVQKSEGKGVTKYHVTIELIADGDNSFKVKYTIAELNVENPQTYEFTTTDSFPESGRMAFVFGASHLSYRISNFSVTNAQ